MAVGFQAIRASAVLIRRNDVNLILDGACGLAWYLTRQFLGEIV